MCDLTDDFALVLHNIEQQPCVGILAHRLVTVSAHANRDDILGTFHALNALAEETVEHLLVGAIVPRTVLMAVAYPFLVVARHRLMVGGTDNNAHFIGGFRVFRVVGVESPVPHGGPQEITLQS